jgi:hypothetical protein
MISRGVVKTNELMEVFANHCSLKNEKGECTHTDKLLAHCISEKKYCPRVARAQRREKAEWKTNYNLYLEEHDRIYNDLIISEAFVGPLQLKYPKIDIRATLDNNAEFWRSREGYERKCGGDGKNIDWEQTYKRGIPITIRTGHAVLRIREKTW